MGRRIMHIDMDAFYAAVEQADHPELKGKPVIVGGSKRGVVSAASYEAREFGVHSAMPIFQAKRLCPRGIFLPVNMRRYKEISHLVMQIIDQISPLVERISIDEAYVDITGTEALYGSSAELCAKLKRNIYNQTYLTCSIGIAPNKFLAKIASDMNKPDGVTIIEEQDVAGFLRSLPITRIPGIGKKTAQTLRELGISMAVDILRFPLSFWTKRLGKYGIKLYEKAQGIDDSAVVPHAEAKSCSAEDTFAEDINDHGELRKWLLLQAEKVGRELRKEGLFGRTVTLKVKFADFRVLSKSRTLHEPTHCTQTIFSMACQLLDELKISGKVRLTGVGVSNLCHSVRQLKLYTKPCALRQEQLDRAMDDIEQRFGKKALKRGRLFDFDSR